MPTKSDLKYHIVWCTKYRRKVLSEDMQEELKKLTKRVCDKNEIILEVIETTEYHVHIFVSANVRTSVHRIVSQIKRNTSFSLRDKFPELKSRLPSLWTRSYYAGTVGHVSEETILKYIKNQKNV